MGETFGLKGDNYQKCIHHKDFFEISPWAKKVFFVTEFVTEVQTPPFYEVNKFNRKCRMEEIEGANDFSYMYCALRLKIDIFGKDHFFSRKKTIEITKRKFRIRKKM